MGEDRDKIQREFNECMWYMEKHFKLGEKEARRECIKYLRLKRILYGRGYG